MIVADTNVWARALVNDDVAQAQRARLALADARSKSGVFLPLIVLAELSWVLRSRWAADRVLITLETLLHTQGVTVEAADLAQKAIQAARAAKGSFADHLIAQVGFASGATQVLTFDEKFSRTAKVRLLK
ncbi:MAG TPA: type II toxin-antitoxin system VapC family toxin [Acidobacteriaceae bacterium]